MKAEFKLENFPVEELKRSGFENNDELNAFRYTDFCYRKFMEAAKKEIDQKKLEPAAKDKGLGELASWPVSIGYFEPKGGDLTPSYQIDFRLYENGVSRELLIDYGDFSIHGTLTALEYLKATECH